MLLPELRERVYKANCDLPKHGLVKFTWGNVSAVDREAGLIVIKPSGVDYDKLSPENMVVADLDGNIVEGDLNPSSDLATHVELYKAFPKVGGVVHTHSTEAVGWAQAGRDIPFYGTTHADYFYGPIPAARSLTESDPMAVPGVTVRNHGPFTWGKTPEAAVYHSVVLEEVAKMARFTEQIKPDVKEAPKYLMDKHYLRKHGPNAYYGQKGASH